MHFPSVDIINRFLEDSCVIVTLAYFLSRFSVGHTASVKLAFVLALAGCTSLVFPGDRYPYVPLTMAAAFAGYAGPLRLGVITVALMIGLFLLALGIGIIHWHFLPPLLSVLIACAIGWLTAWSRKVCMDLRIGTASSLPWILFGAFLAGAAGEAVPLCLRHYVFSELHWVARAEAVWPFILFYSAGANGFGCLLLSLILWDAEELQKLNWRQVQSEREISALRLSQLAELQARLHPHFLFNTLAGIAGLCVPDPIQAELSITSLGSLLRHFLRAPSDVSAPLQEEISLIQSYLALEKLRFGDRLQIREEIAADLLAMPVPRFCLQVLVENAIQHGLSPSGRMGSIAVIVRRGGRYLTLAVGDDGIGFSGKPPSVEQDKLAFRKKLDQKEGQEKRVHGLELLAARLRLTYGESARIRLSGQVGRGSLCVIWLPLPGRES